MKPLTMTVERLASIEHAIDHPSQADMDGEMHTFACYLWDEVDALRAALAAAEAKLEQERVRLAGCGVVAMSDTPESAALQRATPGAYGHSASMDDVARRVDECMALRAKLADERKHADALYGGLVGDAVERTRMTVLHRARRNAEKASLSPSDDGSKEDAR